MHSKFLELCWARPYLFHQICSPEAQLKNEQREAEMARVFSMAPPLFTAKEKMVKLHLLSGKD